MLIRYAYNSYRISMSYDVYRVKNVQKKIADFEHPTCKGRSFKISFNIECFCPYRASMLWQSITQGVALG